VRLSLKKQGREVERSEISVNEISPSNAVAARSTKTYTVRMDFNSDDFDTADLTFSFSDDRANISEMPLQLTGISAYPGFLSQAGVIH
jgi:hypothetical protein